MTKKEEMNDIIQYLIPLLENLGISKEYCKIDVTTESSGSQRGDVWISLVKQSDKHFEEKIVCLIEAKHRKSEVGDADWRDAMKQGKEKACKQGLNYYVVTNCKLDFRFYNSHNDDEIILDGVYITKLMSLDILQKIQTQISIDNSSVMHKSKKIATPISPSKFHDTLKNLADIYRSAGLKKGDERIDPTVSFVVLKYISEKELQTRTLHKNIKLWDSLRKIATDQEVGDLKEQFTSMVSMIWGSRSQYKDNIYKDFKDLIPFSSRLKNEHFKKIYNELDKYHFHGAGFDLFGAIYEEFASQTKKKEFGEFYTRRHITGIIAKLLLRNEINPREMIISDPACGSGGFLTEAYTALYNNYDVHGKLNDAVRERLKKDTFWGYDNDEKSVARTKLNMFLAGDGHIHIYENDSLVDWNPTLGYSEDHFDYILTNPPMGPYDGDADVSKYDFTNEKRYELLFLEKVVKSVKPDGGEIAIVVNDGALETPSRKDFREKLLKHCNIYAIISLTRYAFAPYTKEKTYVLFMQRKERNGDGIQKIPIWHYILDYDGYANSDKRYRTKSNDDLPELQSLFSDALELSLSFGTNPTKFHEQRNNFERQVKETEKEEGLTGYKCKYVEMKDVNADNFFNLLSEYHLRPYKVTEITEKEFEAKVDEINKKLREIVVG
ncbi:MAG: SAM-dependent DNA methyltransferase [Thaumarchaeota archaeon]|nr:SAM-dependent DNA methyltransferase [Nitrososphaerota archaeon]